MASPAYEEDEFDEEEEGAFTSPDDPTKKEESSTTDSLMIGTALFVDFIGFILNFIPVLGGIFAGIIAVFAELGFLLWFKIRGMSYKKNSTFMATWVIVPIIEFIPILNALPAFSAGVITTIVTARAEKKIRGKISGE